MVYIKDNCTYVPIPLVRKDTSLNRTASTKPFSKSKHQKAASQQGMLIYSLISVVPLVSLPRRQRSSVPFDWRAPPIDIFRRLGTQRHTIKC